MPGKEPQKDNFGKIRRDYGDLHERVDNAQGGLGRASKEELDSIMQDANLLLPDVSRPQEMQMDAKLMRKLVRGYKEDADARRGKDNIFQNNDFVNLLGGKYFSNFDDTNKHTKLETWASFGNSLSHIGIKGKCPHLDYMRGVMNPNDSPDETPTPKKVKKPTPKTPTNLGPTKYTIKTADQVTEDKGPLMTDLVNKVGKKLLKLAKRGESINFFEFVIDPKSFSNTVKHIFLTSFLVKDNKATIYIKDELPHIKPARHTGSGSSEEKNRKSSQMILTITKSQWRELIELLSIEESTIQLES